ncbi:helicase-related protein [Novosphingobium tardum]|uniref:Helicase-related protein n=1 Tax=Novosphingobium tardum TaxID=1538021 RepID=A0ABV8RM26_9SPHN
MKTGSPNRSRSQVTGDSRIRAVLGPTNTGKTHLAIERLCAHSSGAIGFPLRLLAREVFDRVRAIKGDSQVALITGEERIEPKDARWLLCTAEAMPVSADLAFVALDEAQLAADPERGHTFTDRLLNARGREETMLLGSATLEPMVRALVPEAEVIARPRFSTLSHIGPRKLSRIPPRSAIVAFSAEQVYAVAEMLRRFRGGAAVVMGALSPQTRNAQVELFQSGEVDYIVATDAIGMGLNLDIGHVAFAGLSKFDGHRQRRLTPSEMAQIAGRAGRHQRDGTFGTLSGQGGHGTDAEFAPEEIYAIEEHRFAPLTHLFWREAEPRFDDLATLIADLEAPPLHPALRAAPTAVDLAVLKHLAEDPVVAGGVRGPALVRRFWEACSLPDFRQLGPDQHARFVTRLWQDLSAGNGYLGADFVAQRIAELDRTGGDIDTLQARIATIRSWAYIAQRPDWVLARDEMAARARAVEARLSDALHARLTERFVNRRTTVLMRKLGQDSALLPVSLEEGDVVAVDGEPIGRLDGFRFHVDPAARAGDRKLLLAAAERHLPELLDKRLAALLADLDHGGGGLKLAGDGQILWEDKPVACLESGRSLLRPRVRPDPALNTLGPARDGLALRLEEWLERTIARDLAPLGKVEAAGTALEAGASLRALALRLVEHGGVLPRESVDFDQFTRDQRERLRTLGVRTGGLDIFMPAMLKPAPLALWSTLAQIRGLAAARPSAQFEPVRDSHATGYRRLGRQWLRVDLADKLVARAHLVRGAAPCRRFRLDPGDAQSMGLSTASYAQLLRLAGFNARVPAPHDALRFGPPAPLLWDWRPPHRDNARRKVPPQVHVRAPATGHFAALAEWGAR